MSQPHDPFQVPEESRPQDSAPEQPAPPAGLQPPGQPDPQHPFNAGATPAQPPHGYYAPPGYPQGYIPAMPPQQNLPQGLSIASMVLGITGIPFSWFLVGIPSILAVIFGHIGLSKANHGTGGGKGMAIAGLVLGYIVVGLFVIAVVASGTLFMTSRS